MVGHGKGWKARYCFPEFTPEDNEVREIHQVIVIEIRITGITETIDVSITLISIGNDGANVAGIAYSISNNSVASWIQIQEALQWWQAHGTTATRTYCGNTLEV